MKSLDFKITIGLINLSPLYIYIYIYNKQIRSKDKKNAMKVHRNKYKLGIKQWDQIISLTY